MVTKIEGALAHETNSPTAATVGVPLYGPSGVMTYRVAMSTASGSSFVDVDSASGDEAAEKAHAKHPGGKVLHIEPAPVNKAK